MTLAPLAIASASDGGTYTLTARAAADGATTDPASVAYDLVHTPGEASPPSRRAWIGAFVGGPVLAALVWGVMYTVGTLRPTSVVAYMLPAAPCWILPLSILIGYGAGRLSLRAPPEAPPSVIATVGRHLLADGQDLGPLVRVEREAHTLALVAERGRRTIEAESDTEAILLLEALEGAAGAQRNREAT